MDRPPTEPDSYCVSGEALTNFEGAYFQPKACFTGTVHTGSSHDTTLHKNAKKGTYKKVVNYRGSAMSNTPVDREDAQQ